MLTPEERFKIGLEILKELGPKLGLKRGQTGTPAQDVPVPAPTAEEEIAAPEAAGAAEATANTLQELLTLAGPLEPGSLVLGACEDGMPLTLELDNPAPGAILIGGDPGSGKTRLLRAILASAALANSPEEVNYCIIASRPEEYADLDNDHCQVIFPAGDPGIPELIEELALEAEARRAARSQGPAILLVIDDLPALLQGLDRQGFSRLYWLVRHGPRSRIWPLASLSSMAAGEMDLRLISVFRSRLTSFTANSQAAVLLTGQPDSPANQLTPGDMFCTLMGSEWLYLWTCAFEPLSQDPI